MNIIVPRSVLSTLYNQEAWTYDNTRGECYLHQFLETQPELNLRSGAVQDHLEVSHYACYVGSEGANLLSEIDFWKPRKRSIW